MKLGYQTQKSGFILPRSKTRLKTPSITPELQAALESHQDSESFYMPVHDKPLPPIEGHGAAGSATDSGADLIAQMRDATYSPSPLLRVLHDPTLLSSGSTENLKKRGGHRSRSPGKRHEHRSPYLAAAAIAEEQRQASHLKSLLHTSGDRLEYEIRRAEDSIARADFAERQEREALTRAKMAEAEKEKLQDETIRLESDVRDYQIRLEASQRETRRLHDDIRSIQRESQELQESEARAQEMIRKYQMTLRDYERQAKERESQIKILVDTWYENGREDGQDEGYELGYQDGRKAGQTEGLKKGRKEGVKEGREQGRNGERRNAIEAFDKFLSEDNDDKRTERTRRWARSIYMADEYSESLGPTDSGSAI